MRWFQLGKDRSRFGKWLDKKGITQLSLEKEANLSRGTISKLCNDDSYRPKISTFARIKQGMKKLGHDVEYEDFWM